MWFTRHIHDWFYHLKLFAIFSPVASYQFISNEGVGEEGTEYLVPNNQKAHFSKLNQNLETANGNVYMKNQKYQISLKKIFG